MTVNRSRFDRAHADVRATFDTYRALRDALDPDDRLTADGRRAELADRVAAAGLTGRLDAARAAVLDAVESADRDAAAVRATLLPPRLTGMDAVAAELRAQRVWARTVRGLDGLDDSAAYLAALDRLRDADPETRAVLLEEVPAYLAARGHDARGIDDGIDRVLRDVSPDYAAALAHARWAARAAQTVTAGEGAVRAALDGTGSDDAVMIQAGGIVPDPPATTEPAAPSDRVGARIAEITATMPTAAPAAPAAAS
ncbi:hypothetical protein [Agromyces binzhouensis]|uniref:hypothetical protein n=1 Tax=Agromyces binzhouensis TaxID=1817495 RepID=UPI00363A1A47